VSDHHGKQELANMREWWRRHEKMNRVVERLNSQAGRCVFADVGIGRVEESELRVLADEKEWNSINDATHDDLFRALQAEWESITGRTNIVEITGPRSSGFQVLRK
jgi:hypothetical protein